MVDQSSFLSSSLCLLESLVPDTSVLLPASTTPALGSLRPERFLLLNHQSARAKALTFCARIDNVRIRDVIKIDGNTQYVVEIFYKRVTNHIPTAQRLQAVETREVIEPDAVQHQRFATFANLRHEMNFHASVGHDANPCAFCASMTSFLSESPTLPRLRLKLFHGQDAIAHALEGFVNTALAITTKMLSAPPTQKLCEGQREIPLHLERFLSPVCGDSKPTRSLPHSQTQRSRKETHSGRVDS